MCGTDRASHGDQERLAKLGNGPQGLFSVAIAVPFTRHLIRRCSSYGCDGTYKTVYGFGTGFVSG